MVKLVENVSVLEIELHHSSLNYEITMVYLGSTDGGAG